MKKSLRSTLALIFVSAFLVSCQTTSNTRASKADDKNAGIETGYATIFDNDKALARDRATDDAKSKLVRKVLGESIEGKSLMENYELVSNIVEARSSGLVRDVRVVEQGDKDGEYFVKLFGRVEPAAIRKAIEQSLERYGRPKIIVLIDETINGEQNNPTATESGALIHELMGTLGFEFVDTATVKQFARTNPGEIGQASAGATNDRTQKLLLETMGAEIIITGKVIVTDQSAVMKKYGNTSLKSMRASVVLKAIDIYTGNILAATNVTAAGVHIDAGTAAKTAIQNSLKQALAAPKAEGAGYEPGPFTKMIMNKFVQGATNRQISLTVSGVNYEQMRKLRDNIAQRVRGVQKVNLRGQQGEFSLVDVYFAGKTNDFIDELQAKSDNFGFQVKVLESFPNRVSLRVTAVIK